MYNMTDIEKKRLKNSIILSFSIHFSLFLLVCILTISAYAISDSLKEKKLEVTYCTSIEIKSNSFGEELREPPLAENIKDIENSKGDKKDQQEEKYESSATPIEQKKNEEEYIVTTNVEKSDIKYVQHEENDNDFDLTEYQENSRKLFWDCDSIEQLEDLKRYYSEIHVVRFCPGEHDIFVIDSYSTKAHHVVHCPTEKDLNYYPLQAKTMRVSSLPGLQPLVHSMLSSESESYEKYRKIYIFTPMYYLKHLVVSYTNLLSKYNLKISDKKVKRVVVRDIKVGDKYTMKISCVIEKDGKEIQIED